MNKVIPLRVDSEDLSETSAKLAGIRAVITEEYQKRTEYPWIVAVQIKEICMRFIESRGRIEKICQYFWAIDKFTFYQDE